MRGVKNVTKGYSAVQVKVRNGRHNRINDCTQFILIWLLSNKQRPLGSNRQRHERNCSNDLQRVYTFGFLYSSDAKLSSSNDFYEIMDMLDKRLNDKGKNWRHVLKSLKVLDYCLHEGSELVVTWARKNIYIIKTLREFQYVDDDGKDVGQNGKFPGVRLFGIC